jgi:hypothetical protein
VEAPTRMTALLRDWWLYDIGLTTYISNNKSLFKDLTFSNLLKLVKTGAGLVYPVAEGNIPLKFFYLKAGIRNIMLNNVLYILEFPINIISGQKYY